MAYLKDEVVAAFLVTLFCALILTVCTGLSAFGVSAVAAMSFTINRDCKDTNCTVNVIDGVCFARYVEFSDDGADFNKLKCDKHRKGTYEVILPCDVTDNGKPRINCDVPNSGIIAALVFLIIAMIAFAFCFCLAWLGTCVTFGVVIESINEESKKIKDKLKQKQDNAQREQKLENDQKTKMENEQRKIEEIQMCEKPQNNKKEPNDDTEPTILPEIDNQAAPDSQHHVPTNYADLHANCTNVFNGGFNEKIHNVAPEMLQNTTHDLNRGFDNAEHTFGFD